MVEVVKKHISSQKFAWNGIKAAFSTELNFRIELFIGFLVFAVSLILRFDLFEWALVVVSVFSVWGSELFNSALEYLADALVKEEHKLIKYSKDIGAAAVLIAAIQSVILGIIVLIHYLGRHGICCG